MSIPTTVIVSALLRGRRVAGAMNRPYNRFSVEEGRPVSDDADRWRRAAWECCISSAEDDAREAGIDVTRCESRPVVLSGARARWFAGLAAAERAEAAERRRVRVMVAVLVAAGAALVGASIALT